MLCLAFAFSFLHYLIRYCPSFLSFHCSLSLTSERRAPEHLAVVLYTPALPMRHAVSMTSLSILRIIVLRDDTKTNRYGIFSFLCRILMAQLRLSRGGGNAFDANDMTSASLCCKRSTKLCQKVCLSPLNFTTAMSTMNYPAMMCDLILYKPAFLDTIVIREMTLLAPFHGTAVPAEYFEYPR
jgi:hypothetical protein